MEEDDLDGLFHCPVKDCNHDGFVSQRGCRKHVKRKHGWFIYFDEKPQHVPNQDETSPKKEENDTSPILTARSVPTFDRSSVIVQELLSWLTGSGGGCKSDRQAQQN